MPKQPVCITVTGAAGQIGYAMLFRIAAGDMLGPDQPISFRLLEIPQAMSALRGVVMELDDCAFPLLNQVVATAHPEIAFEGTQIAMLVGARPRGPGMERKDLLAENGAIFTTQGRALNSCAVPDVKVLVVGNPANTNCLIALNNAKDLSPGQFSAMTILDHNRALTQLAQKTGSHVDTIEELAIWGNHSATMYPELQSTTVKGRPALELVDMQWYETTFIPTIQQRGAQIIQARGSSSAASAANAAIEHMRLWWSGTASTTSMSVLSQGEYDVEDGLIFSFPVTCQDGKIQIVTGRELDEFSRSKIALTERELIEERDAIRHLL